MTIYYSLTFLLLAAEMATFCLLVFPLPLKIRKGLFGFLSTNPIVAKVAYGLKISFIFVGILFLDALQRMFRVTEEVDAARHAPSGDVRTTTDLHARKFYAQRNVYLTGFCLFLSLVLTRTFSIVLELISVQEQLAKSNKEASNVGDVHALKERITKLEAVERDFEILKKQAKQQGVEYNRLADEFNNKTGAASNKKAD